MVTIATRYDVSPLPEDSQEDNQWFRRLKKMKITPTTFKDQKKENHQKTKDSKPKTKVQVSKSTSQGAKVYVNG